MHLAANQLAIRAALKLLLQAAAVATNLRALRLMRSKGFVGEV